MKIKQKVFGWVLVVVICITIEVLFFNFRAIESLTFDEAAFTTEYTVENDSLYIEMNDINQHVDNIYLNVNLYDENSAVISGVPIDVVISKTDAADAIYYELPSTIIVSDNEQSKYLRLHLSGESKKLKVKLSSEGAGKLKVDSIGINEERPFQFSVFRLLVLFVLLGSFYLFRQNSYLFKQEFSVKSRKQLVIMVLFFICYTLLIMGILKVNLSNNAWHTEPESTRQYEMLTKSLTEGHLYLDYEVDSEIGELDNPYDFQSRIASKGNYLFDIAYYKYNYYVYFGIVPVILVYLPIYLITGIVLKTYQVVFMFGLFLFFGILMFLYSLVKRYKLKISLAKFLLADIALLMSAGAIALIYPGNTYTLAILTGIALVFWGLSFWLFSSNGEGRISKPLLVLGSICMALVAGCRPHLAILILTSFVIFYEDIKQSRFFLKKGKWNLLSITLPIILVAIALMIYNYVRFDSIFEFGAKYNFTGVDMTHQAGSGVKFIQGIWEYVFAPIPIVDQFPYLQLRDLSSDYLGYFYLNDMYGGMIWLFPMSLLSVGIFSPAKNGEMKKVGIVLFVLACVIVLADIWMAGITARYMYDFSFIFVIVGIIVYFWNTDSRRSFDNRIKRDLVNLGVLGSLFIQIIAFMIPGIQYGLFLRNPSLFYSLEILFRL